MQTHRSTRDSANRLKTFLRSRRERIRPEELGLPTRHSGRPGLRREDVAELLEVSTLWYALFESATSGRRFSGTFLERVQRLLRLDRAERAEFIELVVTSGHASPDFAASWHNSRWQSVVIDVASTLRQINAAATLEHAAELAGSSLQTLLLALEAVTANERGSELPQPTFAHPTF